ncbi:MAG: GFA family protein [Pseudoxanthomonas sp.]
MSVHRGSCLCGGVRYRIAGDIPQIVMCHCSRCRKVTGSAFASIAPVPVEQFQLEAGQALLSEYESSPGVFRVFCRVCASPLYSRRPAQPALVRVRIGTLDTVPDAPALSHIFTGSKASWFDIHGDAPQYDTRP